MYFGTFVLQRSFHDFFKKKKIEFSEKTMKTRFRRQSPFKRTSSGENECNLFYGK